MVSPRRPQLSTNKATFDTAASGQTFESLRRRYEHYILLARESAQAGDRIEAENLYQHAEHYYRSAAMRKVGQPQ
ncbi:DUF4167 domain-containing protein [Rhizobium sp. A37_96]|nr:DUF4167 domain-containing protein [Rhizobium lusitanum]